MTNDLDYLGADRIKADSERLQPFGGNPFAFVNQPEENVLGADVVVVQEARFFLGKNHNSSCSICEPLKHGTSLLSQSAQPRSAGDASRQYSDGPFLALYL